MEVLVMKKFKDSGDYRSGRDRRRLRKHFWISELLLWVSCLLVALLPIPFGSPYENQEEALRLLRALSEKYGLAKDLNYIGLIKLSEDLKIGIEDLVRILGGLQGVNSGLRKRIRYLHAIKLGKVSVKVPPAQLIPEITPEIEGKRCILYVYIDALEHRFSVYFAINYKDLLPYYVDRYDLGMNEIREYLNEFFVKFMRVKDKSMSLVESDLSEEVRYDGECPKNYRVFEVELIEIETETMRYGLKYSRGKVLKVVGNLPVNEIVRILKKSGYWE
jgi:hypothetical protein